MTFENPFLTRAMREARRERPRLSRRTTHDVRLEEVPGGTVAAVWFSTAGCTWDACTMCDYGKGRPIGMAQIFEGFRAGLTALGDTPIEYLLVSPSGSMFDPGEVPGQVRQRILQTLSEHPSPNIFFETRAETVTDDVLREIQETLANKRVAVMLGLESASPWVQRFCINKGSHPSRFLDARARLNAAGVGAIGNVSLGVPFLSPLETLEHAIASVRWVLSHGAELAVILPVHVKEHTLLAELHGLGLYRSPSLWALVDALHTLGPELCTQVTISWYRNYLDEPFIQSPDTCPDCHDNVFALLDRYRAQQSFEVVEELHASACPCRDTWQAQLIREETSLPDRVWQAYTRIASRLAIESHLEREAEGLRAALLNGPHLDCFS